MRHRSTGYQESTRSYLLFVNYAPRRSANISRGMVRLIAILAVAAGASSAQVGHAPLVGRSTTRMVQVNVVATRRGAPVEGLTRKDFILTDNNKPQTLSAFSEESSGGELPANTPLPPNTFTNRLQRGRAEFSGATIILFDALNTRYTDRAFARNEIVRFLKSIRPDDHVGVYALGSRLQILHEFTSRQTIASARWLSGRKCA